MKNLVEVTNVAVRYQGQRYLKGDQFEMDQKHVNEKLVSVIGEIDETPKTIDEMTVAELKKYAKDNDIDLGEAKKQKDILEVIQAAENDDDSSNGENDQTPPEE